MLRVLADGRPHSRQEILRSADTFFLTNNAASELRGRGHNIERTYKHGEPVYRLVGALKEAPVPPVDGGSSLTGASLSASPNPSPSPLGGQSRSEDAHDGRGGDVLALFECAIDESVGLRGAYGNEAA